MATDAFGRLRVSEPFTTLNYYPSPLTATNGLDVDTWVTINGTNSITTYNNDNYLLLSNATDSYCARYTKMPMAYQAGKSRLIYMTGVMLNATNISTNSYMGLFNMTNTIPPAIKEGVYFYTNGTNLYWGEVTGNNITNNVVQTQWNIDTFDGTGPSGQTLTSANLTKTLLIAIDQEWLGVGRIRCGFIINGILYYAHQFTHTNYDIQYTKTPRLRLCYYITGEANSMRQMCCTCMTEGGYYSLGNYGSVSNGSSLIPITNNLSTKTVILALRVNPSYQNATFNFNSISLYCSFGNSGYTYYEIQMHSTNGNIGGINGSITYTDLLDSALQRGIPDFGTSIQTNGYILTSGYVEARANIEFNITQQEALSPKLNFTQYDTMLIVAICSANASVGASINFIETI
jgi:hypothetical protein